MRDGPAEVVAIPDLREGTRVEGLFAVVVKDLRPFRDPGKGAYMHLQLQNRTGSIVGRIWERAEELSTRFREGDAVWVVAEVNSYRGTQQLIVDDIDPVDPDTVEPEHFLAASARSLEEMEAELWCAIEGLPAGPVARFMLDVFADPEFYQRFTRAPAAKRIHHAHLSGLLEHSLEVLAILCRGNPGGDRLDQEILTCAALLHDVGKIEEYDFRTGIEYSARGRLIGHVVLGYDMVRGWLREAPGVPEPTAQHLLHLLLSHHGQHEYGAPILPQTAEAVALHHADMLSGKIAQILVVGEDTPAGEWSDYDRFLGRQVWRPPGAQERGTQA